MGPEEAKEARPLGQAREQGTIVLRQPARERTVAYPFERMQQPQSHHLTGPEACVGVFGQVVHLLIDLAE